MKDLLQKFRYLNILFLLLVVFRSFSMTHLNFDVELPFSTQGYMDNYRIGIIILLIIEGVLFFTHRSMFFKMRIAGKIIYTLSLLFTVIIARICNVTSLVDLHINHPFLFSLMKNSYPIYGIIISIVFFILLSYFSDIRFKKISE